MSAAQQYEPVSIDLGLLPPSVTPDGPSRAPDRPFPGPDLPRPPLWSPSRRRALSVTVVAAVVSVPGGSVVSGARQADSVPAPIPPPVTVAATGELLAVIGDSGYTAGGGQLTAHSLRTGRRRWSVEVAPSAGQLNLVDAGSYLLLTSQPAGPVPANRDGPDPSWTAAIDARTGVVRWRHTGDPLWVAPGGDRVAMRTVAPPTGANPEGPDGPVDRTVITVLDVATGRLAAAYGPVAPGRRMSVVQSADTGQAWLTGVFVREDPTGGQLFDFASARTRRLDLPLSTPPAPMAVRTGVSFESVLTTGDLILTTTAWGGRAALTGYSGDPPRLRWAVPDLTAYDARRCGTVLCASDTQTSVALDPRTGQIRWRSPGGLLWRSSAGRLYSSIPVYSAGRFDRGRGTGLGVLDAATGRELLRHDEWQPVALVEGGRIPILSYSSAGAVLAILDAHSLTSERLAVLPINKTDCLADAAYVACRTGEHTIRAWRYTS